MNCFSMGTKKVEEGREERRGSSKLPVICNILDNPNKTQPKTWVSLKAFTFGPELNVERQAEVESHRNQQRQCLQLTTGPQRNLPLFKLAETVHNGNFV